MRRLAILLPLTILLYPVGLAVHNNVPSVQLIPASSIQGLTSSENAAELSESKTHNRCFEDMPCWDCRTMGNRICGSLPRTF